MTNSWLSSCGLAIAVLILGASGAAQDDPGTAAEEARAARIERQKAELAPRAGPSGIEHQRWLERAQECLDAAHGVRFAEGAVGWFPQKDLAGLLQWNASSRRDPSIRVAQRSANEHHPIHGVKDFARQLHDRGIEFLFVPVPSRAHIYPEELIGVEPLESFSGHAPGIRDFFAALNRSGVEVVDLVTPFARERDHGAEVSSLFLHRDAHWAPRGARIAAREVAEAVRAMPCHEPGALVEGEDYFFQDSGPTMVMGKGEEPGEVSFRRVVDADGLSFAPHSRTSPILVIGDSFVTFHQGQGASFAAHLAVELGTRLDVICIPGGGRRGVRQSIRVRGDDLAGKSVVIWMLACRCLPPNPRWAPLPIFR